ncbi:putative membrane protein [Sphingomonas jejuensis]|uniref:Membrane protein n=1 Tax=Sphingomonas jejuensis TaxID=904715 RepID=A0ABX0XQ41_9SPHN|nr:SdpI family protein [Sphingomonas jejuensis]NJC34790.1 putative membrane protein [Sphingomonas jejuensis]
MENRGLKIASAATVGVMALVAAVAWKNAAPGVALPVHWDAAGLPDRFADAGTALLTPIAVTILLSLLFAALPSIEPLQRRMEASAPLLRTCWAGLLALMLVVQLMVAAPLLGLAAQPSLILAGVGALLVAVGNALPKSRPGFFVGIRTPWTLADTDNWIATHRFGAWTTVIAGLVILLAALAPIDAEARRSLVIAAILNMVATPVLYSFLIWRRQHRA